MILLNTLERTIKNTGIIFIGEALIKLLDFIIVISLARYLGSSDFGLYSFVFAYTFLFILIPTLGLNKALVREIAVNDSVAERIIVNVLTIRASLSLLAIILSIIIINVLNYPMATRTLVYIASLTVLFSSIRLTFQSLFEANLKMVYSELAGIIGRIISVISVLTIIFFKGSLIYIIIAIVISGFFDLLTISIFFKKSVRLRFEFDFSHFKKIFIVSLPITMGVFIAMLYSKVDILMLSLLQTNRSVGIYSAAFKLIESLSIIPLSLTASLFPMLSKYYKKSEESHIATYEFGFRLLLIIGLPIAVGTTLFSKNIILFIYGSDFSRSAEVLSILIWAELIIFIRILFNNVIISMRKEVVIVYIETGILISCITLNYLLIPKYSYIGASIATLLTVTIGVAIQFYYIYTRLIRRVFKITIIKLILINILLFLLMIKFGSMPLYSITFFSLVFYLLLLILFKLLTKEEVTLFRGFVQDTINLLNSKIIHFKKI